MIILYVITLYSLIKKIKRSIKYKTKTNSYSFKTADVCNVRDSAKCARPWFYGSSNLIERINLRFSFKLYDSNIDFSVYN